MRRFTHYSFRVTNGQRAAVCALMLAGTPFMESCRIAGVPYLRMKALLPPDWSQPSVRRAPRWRGQQLEDLAAAYADPALKIKTIAQLFGIQPSYLRRLAAMHGWPRRRKGGWGLPVSLRNMTHEQRGLYRKLRPVVGREAAQAAVFGEGRRA
jgi:hypothetical protein